MRKAKFILVALVAVLAAGFAFATKTEVPAQNEVGYLYNPATDQFVTASATMGAEGVEFVISERKECGDSFGSDDAKIEEAGYSYLRFKLNGTSNFMRMSKDGVICTNSGYHKWAVKAADKGIVIRCIYTSTQSSGALAPFAQQGFYLTPATDGTLALVETPEDASYWQFMSKADYEALQAEKAAAAKAEADAAAALPALIKKAQGVEGEMSKTAKAALEAALAKYTADYKPALEAFNALKKAYDAASASVIAYKGVRSSYEMHKQFLTGNALKEYEERVAPILAALDAGTLEGNGLAEMAEIARASAEAKGAAEVGVFDYETTCEATKDYVPGGNHGITIDWDAIAAALNVTKDGLKIFAVMPDGTLDESYGRGSAGTDGWRDAEGNWLTWNTQDNMFYVQFTGLNLDGVGCMRTAEPTKYTASFKVVSAEAPEANWVTLNISLVVTEKYVSPFTQFSQLQVAETKTQKVNVGTKPGYEAAKNVDADIAGILATLGASSIKDVQIFSVQADGTLDADYKLGPTDGWRNAAGSWAGWGDATSQFYVKSDFSRSAGQLYEIGCHPDHNGAHMQGGAKYVAKFAFVVGNSEANKSVVLNVAVQSDGEPVAPAAPTASKLATDGTAQYFFNVEAKGFLLGANDWGTRASIAADRGYLCRFEANGDTYQLADQYNGNWHALDCQGADNIWVDGEGRGGSGMWTYTVNSDGSFTIANNNVPGLLSAAVDTKLYMSEASDAMSKWIAVSEADFAAYQQSVKDYQAFKDEWDKENYAVGDQIVNIAPKAWDGQTGTFGTGRYERYSGGGSIAAGDVMTQTLTGLKDGIYEVTLEASASYTSGRGFECPTGDGMVEVFANNKAQGINVIDRGWVSDGEFDVVTLTTAVVNGTLKYGIRNLVAAGNWYVANITSLVYVSDAPKATALDVTGATAQYFYNVEAQGFLLGANDWQTRASIGAKGFDMHFEANGETYKLCAINNTGEGRAGNDLDCQAADQIWVDGAGRGGAGMWTFSVNEDGTFTIANANVPGLLSAVGGGDTKLYMSEDPAAMSTWIAVSAEDYQEYSKKAVLKAEAATLAEIKEFIESTNFYTQDAYDAYYQMYADAIAKNAAGEAVGNLDNPNTVHGWHATNAYDDFLLSAWTYTNAVDGTRQCNEFDTPLYINTWSTEADGKENASPMHVPFFEYWTGDDNSLGEATLEGTVTGLKAGTYAVSAVVRVRIKNGGGEDAYGITFSANGSDPVNVCNGRTCGDGDQFRWTFAMVNGVTVGDDGILKVAFNVAADNNISWLSYKNVTYMKGMTPIIIGQEATAITEVKDNPTAAKAIFNAAGQKVNSLQKGFNIVDGKKVYVK